MKTALLIVLVLGWSSLFVYAGARLYFHRERIRAALDVLQGHTELGHGTFRCGRTHVEASHRAIKIDELAALRAAVQELGVARGFVSASSAEAVAQYAKMVEGTVAVVDR